MDTPKFHEIWVEQCEAAEGIKRRYGTKAAFDYLVAEKLFNFADAASSHPAFARELPRFVAHVRGLFTVEEMRTHLNRIQCEQRDGDAYIGERDEFDEEGEQEEDAMSLAKMGAPWKVSSHRTPRWRDMDSNFQYASTVRWHRATNLPLPPTVKRAPARRPKPGDI